ncbi:MAG: two-component system response regulator [Lysobacterales bacterium 14-68-21]|jgi:CheY-like chemotaxis protein|nr:MAG: two-component system response regulator [Xanthomonadales bacterium 15-68-25]OZB66736.1 MAG: two-component system response regulator [Xanthomonadales bacterium 14-68-21]
MTQLQGTLSILVAEDDADDRVLLSDAFAESGVEVSIEFVADGVELMARLAERDLAADEVLPDLVLLDLNMPRMDGREALRAIRDSDRLRHLPAIILTTSKAELDIRLSYQLGANSYVTKPRRFEELITVLRSLERYWMDIVQLPSGTRREDA